MPIDRYENSNTFFRCKDHVAEPASHQRILPIRQRGHGKGLATLRRLE